MSAYEMRRNHVRRHQKFSY